MKIDYFIQIGKRNINKLSDKARIIFRYKVKIGEFKYSWKFLCSDLVMDFETKQEYLDFLKTGKITNSLDEVVSFADFEKNVLNCAGTPRGKSKFGLCFNIS